MLHVLEAAKAFKKQQNGAFQGELVFPIDFELPRWIPESTGSFLWDPGIVYGGTFQAR